MCAGFYGFYRFNHTRSLIFISMRDQYIRTGQGFLLVFSVVSLTSFQAITSFYERIMQVKECDTVPMVIVGMSFEGGNEFSCSFMSYTQTGNKIDLPNRTVTTKQGQDLAEKFSVPYVEASAKTRVNVEEAFYSLVREVRRHNKEIGRNELNSSNGNISGSGSGSKVGKSRGCILI